jgi:hypothetical protein
MKKEAVSKVRQPFLLTIYVIDNWLRIECCCVKNKMAPEVPIMLQSVTFAL